MYLDDPRFLEAPHAHDPKDIASYAALPRSLLQSTPESVLQLLASAYQSTSILFASLRRLEELHKDRFNRLCPSEQSTENTKNTSYAASLHNGQFAAVTVNEHMFLSYTNQLKSEKRYFFEEACVDFRQKAKILEGECSYTASVTDWDGWNSDGDGTGFEAWWNGFMKTVQEWIRRAEAVPVRGLEETVEELQEMYQGFARSKENRAPKGLLEKADN